MGNDSDCEDGELCLDPEPERVPELLDERLAESRHHEALEEAEEALLAALRTSEGYPFDREAGEHLRASLRRLRQSRELYRAWIAKTLIGDLEQGRRDR